jgi:transposase InsO family protein
MTKPLDPIAMFRLTVLGPLTIRTHFEKGERAKLIKELASQAYAIPGTNRTRLSEETIYRWYALWKHGGVEALAPKARLDKGRSSIPKAVQEQLIAAKKERPSRSINTLITLLQTQGLVSPNQLSRSSVHRLLVRNNLSKRPLGDSHSIERRAFEAAHAGDIWYGDVMHGPSISTSQGRRKVYLISLMDDASRLVCHSAFYFAETAVFVEQTLKEAILKRGLPKMLVVDNGPAYRAETLQTICARLGIRLVYCRPYEPEGKGKLERWHRTFRADFLAELSLDNISGLSDLNQRLWLWIENIYHQRKHSSLDGKITPLSRWRSDLMRVRQFDDLPNLDEYFHHRIKRKVRRDTTVSWEGRYFEIDFPWVGQEIYLVVDPSAQEVKWAESLEYERICSVVECDKLANNSRSRQRSDTAQTIEKAARQPEGLVDAVLNKEKSLLSIIEENK